MKYKIKEGYICHKIGTGYAAVTVGDAADEFNGMIRLNAIGAEIFKMLQADWCTEEMIVQDLVSSCEGAEESKVRDDVSAFLEKIRFALEEEE